MPDSCNILAFSCPNAINTEPHPGELPRLPSGRRNLILRLMKRIPAILGKINSWNILLSHLLNSSAIPLLCSTIFATNCSISGLLYGGLSQTRPPHGCDSPFWRLSYIFFAVGYKGSTGAHGSKSKLFTPPQLGYQLRRSIPLIGRIGASFKPGIHNHCLIIS